MFKHLFNVITGNDLGKSTSSFSQLGSLLPSEPFGQAAQELSINATTGNIYLKDHAKTIVDLGFNLKVGMVYNSQAKTSDQAWRFSLGKTIGPVIGKPKTKGSSVTINQPDGSVIIFNYDVLARRYVAQGLAGGNQYLTKNPDGTWECWQPGSGIKEHYDAKNNKQTDTVDASGNKLTFLYNSGSGLLEGVQGSSGQRISIVRKGLVSTLSLTSPEGIKKTLATYTYDEQNRLKQAAFPLNDTESYSVNYDYLGNTLALYMIRQGDGSKLQFDYQKQGDKLEVVEITDGEGRSYKLDYLIGKTQLTDALENIIEFDLNSQGQIKNLIKSDIQGKPQITQYDYYDTGALEQISYSDNTEESFNYDALGLLSTFADGLGQTTRYYNNAQTGACYSKTQYLKNSQGQQPLTTWYVRDDKRQLCYEISPTGTVTQYDNDLNGNPVAIRQCLVEQIDISQFKPDVEIEVSTLDAWWSQLKDQSKISLKELDYNSRGQVKCETTYTDINENGGGVYNNETAKVETEWGLFNQWKTRTERQTFNKEATTEREYDGLTRLAYEIDAEKNKTEYEYRVQHPFQEQGSEVNYTQIITLPNNLKKETVYDHSGRPSQFIDIDKNNVARITRYNRDAAGRILAVQQPDGRYHFDYFDPQGRLAYEINARGYVTEHRYDVHNREIETIQYAQNILIDPQNPPLLKDLMTKIVKNDKDRHQYNLYNATGKLQYQIDGENGLTQHFYDSTNRKIKTQRYADPISDGNIQTLLAGNIIFIPANEKDRIHYFYYDNDDNLIGELDPENYVTEYVRNAAGRLKEKAYYDTPSQYKADFNKVRPGFLPEKDAHEYYYRDAKGNCLRKINAENVLTVYHYNANGKLAKKIKYKNPVDPKNLDQIPEKHFEDRHFVYQYDLLNRTQICDEYPLKKRTFIKYDALGNKTSESVIDISEDNNNPARSEVFEYNAWGQVTKHTNSRGGITEHIYDNSGLRLQTIDPAKNSTFFYYNDARQLCLTINGEGSIKQEEYDAFDNKPNCVRSYAKQLTKDQLETLSGGFYTDEIKKLIEPLKDDKKDSVLPVMRDRRGLSKTEIDAEGYATHYQHNTFKECVNEAKQITKPEPVAPVTRAIAKQEEDFGFELIEVKLDSEERVIQEIDWDNNNNLIVAEKLKQRAVMSAKAGIQGTIKDAIKPKFLTTTHDYNKRGLETQTIVDAKTADNPNGLNITKQQTYNMHGKVKERIDERGYAHQFEYDRLAREIEYTDPKNNTRKKTWDFFDRLETETDRCGKDTKYSYNTPERKTTVTTPENRVTVTQTNAFNETISTQDANGATEIFERDKGGQISAKTDALKRRTEDQYDSSGRHEQHRDFTGVNTNYKFDAANQINFYADAPKNKSAEALTTQIKRDSQGNEIAKTNSRNVTKVEERDCRGLEVNTIIDPSELNLTISHTYNGLKQKKFTFQGDAADPKQHITQTLHDSAGRENGKIVDPQNKDNPNGKNLKTANSLDNTGNVIATQDPNGNIARNIFDELNRKVFVIDQTGAVTESQYDAEGHEVLRRNYANRIDISKINDNTTPEQIKQLIQPSAQDRSLYSRYDGDGKLIFSITNTGRVTEHLYDKAGRQIGFTRYASPIDPAKLTTLDPDEVRKILIKNPDNDRTYYGVLDLAGQVRFNIGADGHVVEQKFDDRGNIIAKIVYKNAIDITQINSLSTPDDIAKLLQPAEGQDRITHQIFDGFNRLTFSINPRNYVTEYKYDEEDNPITTIVYYNRIPTLPEQKTVDSVRAALIRDPKNPKDRITQQIYDNADRKIEVIDGLGFSEAYEFDVLNQLRTRKDKMGYLWKTAFNAAGRKTFDSTPETTITNVTFDDSGKLVLLPDVRGSIITAQECDANGNVTSITLGSNSVNPRKITFTYTANNLLDTTIIEEVAVDDPTIITPVDNKRPEKIIPVLTTKTVYNAWSQPVAYKNEKDIWSFKVFNTEGHLVYEIDGNLGVTEHQWNAFGEEEKVIRYNTPLAINPQNYAATGLSEADVQANLKKDPANDRTISTEYNKRGSKTQVLQDKILMYNPLLRKGSKKRVLPKAVSASPEKQWQYNDFNEEIYESELIDPITNRRAKKYKWRDLQGNIIAKADANGFVKLFQLNGDGKPEIRIEFKKALSADNFVNASYEELVTLAENVQDQEKQIYHYEYDVLGQLTGEIVEDVTVHKVVVDKDGKLQVENLSPEPKNLEKHYKLDGMGRTVETVHENGKSTTKSFDEIGRVSEETKLPRESKDDNNNPITYIEKIQFGYNEFGNKTKINRTSSAEASSEKNPKPKYTLPPDQTTLRLYDVKRGLNITEQDPMGNRFDKTWTETKRDGRTYGMVSYWVQDQTDKTQFTLSQRLSQLRNKYDNVDNETGNYRRDYKTNTDIATESLFNAFNEKVAEGPGNDQWPLVWDFDQAGRCYYDNENGIPKFHLQDGRGINSCELKSPLINLAQKDYSDIPDLLTLDYTKLQRTEEVTDDRGDIIEQHLPSFKRLKKGEAEPLYTGFTVGEQYANFFGAKNISWPAPVNMNFVAELKVWPKGTDESKAIDLKVKTQVVNPTTGATRMGADISQLITDIYEYKLSYYYNDPNIEPLDNPPVYSARGEISFDTNNNQGSQNLVMIQQDDSTIILTGKTTDPDNNNNVPLSGVELIQNGQVVARVAASTTNVAGRYSVDLSNQISGTYTCRPIFGFVPQGNPISIGQSSPQGFSLEAHSTSVTLDSKYTSTVYWSDLPPGVVNLKGKFSYYQISNQIQNFYAITTPLTQVVQDFPTTGGEHGYYINQPITFSITNSLSALDSQQKEWFMANAYNPNNPNNSGMPAPLLYVVPTQATLMGDAIAAINNGNTETTLGLFPWMGNGMQFADISQFKDYKNCQYQVLKLNPSSSNSEESQPFTIFTKSTSPKLTAREIAVDDFQVYQGYYMFAYANTFRFSLPKDLDVKEFHGFGVTGGTITNEFYFGKDCAEALSLGDFTQLTMNIRMDQDWMTLFSAMPYERTQQQNGRDWLNHYAFNIICFDQLPSSVASVQFEYYDYTLGNAATWRTLSPQFSDQKHFMTVDVQALQFGQYDYRFKAFDAQGNPIDLSNITDVENGYAVGQFKVGSANTYVTPPQPEIYEEVNPTRSQKLDYQADAVESTDEFGNTTKCTFTYDKKLQTETKPKITVTEKDGQQKQMNPTTTKLYDEMSNVIGVEDANKHLKIHERNSAGETTKTTQANGDSQEFIRDAFGCTTKEVDGLNRETTFEHDKNNLITKKTDANDWEESYYQNELKQRIGLTNGEGHTTRYNLDCWGNGSEIYQPLGQVTKTVFDRNRKPVLMDDGTDNALTWNRDYFGDPLFAYADEQNQPPVGHTDKSGALYTTICNYNRQIVQQQSSGGSHGKQYGPNNQLVDVPSQNLRTIYNEAGHVAYKLDDNADEMSGTLTTRYRLDDSGRRIGEWFMASDGKVYQDSHLTFNACGWLTGVEDARMIGKYGFTPTGARRNSLVYYNPNFLRILGENKKISPELLKKMQLYSVRNWNDYDDADNFTVFGGDLMHGEIGITKNKGVKVTYDKGGRRDSELRIDDKGKPQPKQLFYLDNGLLDHTTSSDGNKQGFGYNKAYDRSSYNDKDGSYQITYNPNSWIDQQVNTSTQQNTTITTTTTFDSRDNDGRVLEQTTVYHVPNEEDVTDVLDSTYVGFDDEKLSQNTLTRENNQQKNTAEVFMTYDANSNIQSVQGAIQESFRLFVTNSQGRIVLKRDGQNNKEYYFYDANGNPIGRFGDLPDPKTGEPKDVNFDLNFNAVSDKFPPPAPGIYVATEDNLTFDDIAEYILLDRTLGDKVAQFNGNYTGNDPAPVGVPIQIPNVVSLNTHNWEGNYPAYNPNEIMGGTYPNMPFPPPILKPQHRHHSFFKEFLEFAVAAAALALIPELAGAIAPMIATILGTATEGLVTTVISNIIAGETLGLASSLAQQETARALGDQNHFNYHQFWESGFENAASAGLSAGLNAEFGAMKFPNPLLKQAFQTDIPRAELFALGMQAANLAYKGGKFDWKALLMAALQAPVNKVIGEVGSQMPTQGPISSALANSGFYGPVPSVFADDLISQEVYTHHFDPQLAAADALGSDAGNMTAFALYDVYKRRADQQAQMGWKKQSQTNKPTEQTNSLDQLNATTSALNKETQKINAELAALGNINPFTGEPLDSGVTNVGATLRGCSQGTSDDPSANANIVNKNPSYANRQVQHATTDNQNQLQNAVQQQQTNLAAKGSSKFSFWGRVENGITNPFEWTKATTEKLNDIAKAQLPEYKNLSQSFWSKATKTYDNVQNLEANIASFEDIKLIDEMKTTMTGFFDLATKYQAYEWGIKGLDFLTKGVFAAELGFAGMAVYEATPNQRTRVEFEQVGQFTGGTIGTFLGLGAGAGEEVVAPLVSTPVAVATIVGSTVTLGEVGKELGDKLYDAIEDETNGLKP